MYQKIMVPLDGSKLAECALPYAENIATGCDAQEIILVSVTERIEVRHIFHDSSAPVGQQMLDASVGTAVPPPGAVSPEPQWDEVIGKMDRQAQKYLSRIAKDLEAKGIKVKTQVLRGVPAEEIVAQADNDVCDLIVMASHGRTGPTKWALGSVTEKVFRKSCVPVLMVRGPGCVLGV